MRSNRPSSNSVQFTASQNQGRIVFDRMGRSIARLAKDLSPENVHHFRTDSRRVEAVVTELAPETRNKKKLLKVLSKLRKKAGKLRDIDVQMTFLKNQKTADRQNHRGQMLELLAQERAHKSRKLAKAADSETVAELRKRLRREQAEVNLENIDPLRLAYAALPKPAQDAMTEKTLHGFRIAAKRARYLAELGADNPDAKFFVEELKRAQDAVGEWHDIVKLKQKAESRFGSASDSALVSLLQNISRARFRNATATLTSVLSALAKSRQLPKPVPAEKLRASSVPATTAAVA